MIISVINHTNGQLSDEQAQGVIQDQRFGVNRGAAKKAGA